MVQPEGLLLSGKTLGSHPEIVFFSQYVEYWSMCLRKALPYVLSCPKTALSIHL